MKLLHLSDLHLGKRVNEVSMIEDQKHILGQILSIIEQEKVEAILICGDVYDRAVPSAEAVELLDDFLCSLAGRHLQVYLISGNHDCPQRLSFANRLLDETGIHICGVYDGTVQEISVQDEYGEIVFHMLPFVKPAHVRRFFPEAQIESYTDAVRIALSASVFTDRRRHVLLTHQFVTGANRCDSEELSVGGSDQVDADVFAGADYVALGHLHGPQSVSVPHIRYCGTPLKYSFSEVDHTKSVTVIEMREKGNIQISTHPLHPLRDLRQLRGTYDQLTDRRNYAGTATDDYLHIILTDEEDVPEAVGRLRAIYPNLMKLSYDNTRTRSSNHIDNTDISVLRSPLELFCELYEQQNNQPMSDAQRMFSAQIIEKVQEECI